MEPVVGRLNFKKGSKKLKKLFKEDLIMESGKILMGFFAVLGFVVIFGILGSVNSFAKPPGVPSQCQPIYKFNMIGHPGDYDGGCGSGHRIFVDRDAHHAHVLVSDHNDGWHVENCDATGGDRGELHSDDLGSFDVYVRILGKPNGTLDICADTVTTHDVNQDHLCLLGSINLMREGGKSQFSVAPDSMFDAELEDIVWSIDTNNDFRIAEFRVYDCNP